MRGQAEEVQEQNLKKEDFWKKNVGLAGYFVLNFAWLLICTDYIYRVFGEKSAYIDRNIYRWKWGRIWEEIFAKHGQNPCF